MEGKSFYIFNAVILMIGAALGIFYPKVGDLKGYVSVVCGFLLVYLIPIGVFLLRYRLSITDPEILNGIDTNRISQVKRGYSEKRKEKAEKAEHKKDFAAGLLNDSDVDEEQTDNDDDEE